MLLHKIMKCMYNFNNHESTLMYTVYNGHTHEHNINVYSIQFFYTTP